MKTEHLKKIKTLILGVIIILACLSFARYARKNIVAEEDVLIVGNYVFNLPAGWVKSESEQTPGVAQLNNLTNEKATMSFQLVEKGLARRQEEITADRRILIYGEDELCGMTVWFAVLSDGTVDSITKEKIVLFKRPATVNNEVVYQIKLVSPSDLLPTYIEDLNKFVCSNKNLSEK